MPVAAAIPVSVAPVIVAMAAKAAVHPSFAVPVAVATAVSMPVASTATTYINTRCRNVETDTGLCFCCLGTD